MKFIKQTVYAITIVLLLPATFLVGESSDQTRTRKEAVQLTKQIERSSRKIHSESAHLSSMHRNPHLSKRSHQYKLQAIANEVNDQLSPALTRLAEIQPDLPQWNQHAVERMRTSAASIAANTNDAVLNRNEVGSNRFVAFDEDYGRLVDNISSHAESLTQVADATVDYGTAQLKGANAGLPIASHD